MEPYVLDKLNISDCLYTISNVFSALLFPCIPEQWKSDTISFVMNCFALFSDFFFPFYLIRIFPGRLIRLFVWPTQLNMLGLEWMVLANAQNVNRSTAHVSLLLPCINNKFRNVARYTHICLVFFPFTAVFSLHSRRLNFITTTEHLETC